MKRINKLKLRNIENKDDEKKLFAELEIMKKLFHPNIVRLHEIINDPSKKQLCLIIDLFKGGSVQSKLELQKN